MEIFEKQVFGGLLGGFITTLILGLFVPSPVQAALVAFHFEGDILDVSDFPELPIAAGTSIKGSFVVDPLDRLPSDPTVGSYAVPTLSISLAGST